VIILTIQAILSRLKYNAKNDMALCTRGCGSGALFSNVARADWSGKKLTIVKNKYIGTGANTVPVPEE
jgi:hypothetical protein